MAESCEKGEGSGQIRARRRERRVESGKKTGLTSPGESLALSLSCERGEERRGKERRKERGDRDTPTPPEKRREEERREGSGVARTRDKKKRSQAKSGAYLRFRLFSKGPAPHLLI